MASDTSYILKSGARVTVPGQLLDVLGRWPAERRFIDQIAAPGIAMLRLSERKKLTGPEELAMRDYTLAVANLRASQMQIENMIRTAVREAVNRGELDPADVRARVDAWARPAGLQLGPAAIILVVAAMAAFVFLSREMLAAWNVYQANKAAANLAAERNRAVIAAALARNETPPELPTDQTPNTGRGPNPLDTLARGAGSALVVLALGALVLLAFKARKDG